MGYSNWHKNINFTLLEKVLSLHEINCKFSFWAQHELKKCTTRIRTEPMTHEIKSLILAGPYLAGSNLPSY